MKNRKKQVFAAVFATVLLAGQVNGPGIGNQPRTVYAVERSATVNGDIVNVRSGAGTNNSVIAKLSYGTAVTVIDEARASNGATWYRIRFTSGSQTKEGYASSQYIKFPVTYSPDANFESYLNSQRFPESYKDPLRTLHTEHPSWVFQAQHTNLEWNDAINNESMVGANLVDRNSVSSWKSTEYGAYDWNTGVWTGFDGASWVAASKEIVSYYMDPRNFLNDTYVFQFLLHTYDSNYQTRDGLQSMISGTFLSGTAAGPGAGSSNWPGTSGSSQNIGPGYESTPSNETEYGSGGPGFSQPTVTEQNNANVSLERPVSAAALTVGMEYGPGMDPSYFTDGNAGSGSNNNSSGPSGGTNAPSPSGQSYVDIIMNAAAQSGVNPYVLAAMILQEQGTGTSRSISGTDSNYGGYYNFFNVGAYASDSMDAVTRGLWYASQSGTYGRPWNSIERSIVGGALYYGENFVKQGQDTFYLKKFNVQGSNLYKHQYMTNIQAAAAEAAKMEDAYTDTMKNQTLVFKIPVFNNMPETACAQPTMNGSPNNKLSSLSVEGYSLTPTFSRDTESYDVIVNPSVSQIAVSATVIDSKASVSGTGVVNLNNGANTVSVEVRAENGSVRVYRLNIVRQNDAPVVNVTNSGGTSGTNTNGNTNTGNNNNSNNSTGSGNFGPGMTGGPGFANSTNSSGSTEQSTSSGQPDVQVGVAPV